MKEKAFAISLMLVAFLAISILPIALAAPKTADMEIHIYLDPDTENAGMDDGTLDINDWPLSKEWIDLWALQPESIQMRDYVELGQMEIDINHQRWPTGVVDMNVTQADIAADPDYNASNLFRKAVACLMDVDAVVRDVLKGYGYRLDLPMVPFQSDYMDMPLYHSLGLIYDYNTTRAAEFLDAGGFIYGSDAIRNDPRKTGDQNLDPITLYGRQDDPNRRRAGEMLAAELTAIGVPTNLIITEKTVCYKQVMVLYDYHLYTGGWSLSTIPDQYYDLYSQATYWGPDVGWALNYPGNMNHEFFLLAKEVKYPATVEDAKAAAKECGKKYLDLVVTVPLYATAAVKAYKTGWTGVVNNGAFGIDNYWTFLNMYKGDDSKIDWGFKSNIEQLNMISSEWLWDHNVLGLIYETLLGTNPFNLAPSEFWIADKYSVGSWDATGYGGDSDATYITFNIRNNIPWHNGTTMLTVDDCTFSFNYTYDAGPGVAWQYVTVADMARDKVHKINATAFEIYFIYKSAWAVQWAGGIPIVRESLWSLVPFNETRTYDPANEDRNSNGVIDLCEDGTGAWEFDSYNFGNWVKLKAWNSYYLSQSYITDRLADMFHYGAGDVDDSSVVGVRDLGFMARSLGTNSTHYPSGTGWDEYNSACDLDKDGDVDGQDLIVVTANYGKTQG